MRFKILSGCFMISLGIVFVLIVYMIQVKPECKKTHLDERQLTYAGSLLDEDLARKLADVVIGAEDDSKYDVEVTFDDQSYEWVIDYRIKKVQAGSTASGNKVVRIRKDNGIITVYDS